MFTKLINILRHFFRPAPLTKDEEKAITGLEEQGGIW